METGHFVQKINAILRFHYRIEPEKLSTKEWAKLFNEYKYVRKIELKDTETVYKMALIEVLNTVFAPIKEDNV